MIHGFQISPTMILHFFVSLYGAGLYANGIADSIALSTGAAITESADLVRTDNSKIKSTIQAENKNLNKLLNNGDLIVIKSVSSGNYYKANTIDSLLQVKAIDKKADSAALFVINKSKTTGLITLLSKKYNKMLVVNADTKDIDLVQPRIDQLAQWDLMGTSLENCYFKNKKTEAILMQRSDDVVIKKLEQEIKDLELKHPYVEITYAEWGLHASWVNVKDALQNLINQQVEAQKKPGDFFLVTLSNSLGTSGSDGLARASWQKKFLYDSTWYWGSNKYLKLKSKGTGALAEQEVYAEVLQGDPLTFNVNASIHPSYIKRKQLEKMQQLKKDNKKSTDDGRLSVGYVDSLNKETNEYTVLHIKIARKPTTEQKSSSTNQVKSDSSQQIVKSVHKVEQANEENSDSVSVKLPNTTKKTITPASSLRVSVSDVEEN